MARDCQAKLAHYTFLTCQSISDNPWTPKDCQAKLVPLHTPCMSEYLTIHWRPGIVRPNWSRQRSFACQSIPDSYCHSDHPWHPCQSIPDSHCNSDRPLKCPQILMDFLSLFSTGTIGTAQSANCTGSSTPCYVKCFNSFSTKSRVTSLAEPRNHWRVNMDLRFEPLQSSQLISGNTAECLFRA